MIQIKIKDVFVCLIIFLVFENNNAQEIRINKSYADSIRMWNYDLGSELQAILLYNEAVKSFGYDDTLVVNKSGNQFQYNYKDSLIPDIRWSRKPKVVMMTYSSSPTETFLVSQTQQSHANKFEVIVRDAPFDSTDLIYKLRNYLNDVQNGRFEERTKSGQLLVLGYYCQIDSNYTDTIKMVDPETYDDYLEIIPRTKFPVKSGVWKYYNNEGVLTKEEIYNKCT